MLKSKQNTIILSTVGQIGFLLYH